MDNYVVVTKYMLLLHLCRIMAHLNKSNESQQCSYMEHKEVICVPLWRFILKSRNEILEIILLHLPPEGISGNP